MKTTKATKRKILREWLKWLRDPKNIQGSNKLEYTCGGITKNCCLGGLCNVVKHVIPRIKLEKYQRSSGAVSFNGRTEFVPPNIMEAAGLSTKGGAPLRGACLVERNDRRKWSFRRIATWVESKPKGLFIEE